MSKIFKAVFPGSFDPFTNGHKDIVENALQIFDHLVIAIGRSSSKAPVFTVEERLDMIAGMYQANKNVEVLAFEGLAVNFAKEVGARAMVRGLRTEADFSYEMPMAITNKRLAPEMMTVFLPTSSEFAYVSSSLVKEVALNGGDVGFFLPDPVLKRVSEKFNK